VTLVGLTSVRGGPGVTTTSLLLASALAQPTVLVEADFAGGVLAVRYGLGREPGLTTLAASAGLDPDGWREHAQDAGGVAVLVGPDSPDHARSLWQRAGGRITRVLTESGSTALVDLGRVGDELPCSGDLALLVVVVRPVADHLVTLSHRLAGLRRHAKRVGVLLVGDGDYRADDVRDSLGVDVLGALPADVRTAEAMAGRGRSTNLSRSPLYRSVTTVAAAVDTVVSASSMERVS
jgi:hypothetical protein